MIPCPGRGSTPTPARSTIGESDFEIWNTEYVEYGNGWWFEYYDYWEMYDPYGNIPLQSDPGGLMKDGKSSITLNRNDKTVTIIADVIYTTPQGDDIHLRINYDGPAKNL